MTDAVSGYANGRGETTQYELIGQTGHAETVHVTYDAIRPAYHMNKEHWSDIFVERRDNGLIKQLITQSYENIIATYHLLFSLVVLIIYA